MSLVFGLVGAPGAGKSTMAAALYTYYKKRHIKVELVREYVKDYAWEGRRIQPLDQTKMFGEQASREALLYGRVDLIVTDSPLCLFGFYQEHYTNKTYVGDAVRQFKQHAQELYSVQYLDVFLPSQHDYQAAGRFETADQARVIEDKLRQEIVGNRSNLVVQNLQDCVRIIDTMLGLDLD